MKNFTPIFLVFFLALYSSFIVAQEAKISGIILNTSGNPIPFANVILYAPDQVVVKGTITDDTGRYNIVAVSQGTYVLKVSFVGYQDYVSEEFMLSGDKELSDIKLEEITESLNEVTVISKRPTIVREVDRLIFNVENTIASTGSAWEILKRTPGVVVKQDALTVRNNAVNVYLNDRKVELSFEEIQGLLEAVSGADIKSVEVITNPSAKYDAEGGAIINIVSSKALYLGYKGSVTA
jgi:hypothetical protein